MTQSRMEAFDLPGLTRILAEHADDVEARRRLPTEAFAALRERGLMGANISVEHGGLGLRHPELFEVCEAIGLGCGTTQLIYDQHLFGCAYVQRWASPPVAAGLRRFATGDDVLGITAASLRSNIKARRRDGRMYFSGTQHWYTGVGLMTHALIAAEDEADPDQIWLAVAPMTGMRIGPPHELVVLTASMTCPLTFEDLDVTDGLLPPRTRAAVEGQASIDQIGIVLGNSMGMLGAVLAQCRALPVMRGPRAHLFEFIERPAAELRAEILERLRGLRPDGSDTAAGVALRQAFYARISLLLSETTALMMAAAGGSSIKEGARVNRLARELLHFYARRPLRLQLPLCVGRLMHADLIGGDDDDSDADAEAPDAV